MPPCPGDVQWFPAEIRRLISAIKKHEALFNPRHESFGLREFQNRTWKSVAELVGGGKTDIQCRDKWNCLRGTYRRHVRTEATNNVRRRSGWPWAEMMSFIKPFVMEKEELMLVDSHSGSNTPPTSKPSGTNQTLLITQTSGNVQSHKPQCPVTNVKQIVNFSTTNGVTNPGTLTFTRGLYPGGIILNTKGVGIGIVQPNQTNVIGVVQPRHSVSLVQPNQAPVNMNFIQTSQSKINATSNPSLTDKNSMTSVKSNPGTNSDSNITIDLDSIKQEPDASKSPVITEFVDMEVAIKKEPMEEDELQLPEEFNFLPEDSAQENSQEGSVSNRESNGRSPDKNVSDQNHDDIDSNELFMRSTISHMRKLSPYDQSVFKLKVQQLLHEMMFPQQP